MQCSSSNPSTPFARSLRNHETDAERKLWKTLRGRQVDGFKFRRQQPIGKYIADFCCFEIGLIVELDGGQHTEQLKEDEARTAFLRKRGFTVMRFWNHEVLTATDMVLENIFLKVEELSHHPHPNPLPQGPQGEGE